MSEQSPDATEQQIVVIGPDGQPVGIDAGERHAAGQEGDGDDEGEQALDRPGGAAREGDAHRQHDPAAARRGEGRAARRRQPPAAPRHPPGLDQGARGRPRSRAGRGARPAVAAVHGGHHARPTPSSGSPRRSSSAGWRACSTASRRRSTRSRWRRAPSSSRSDGRCLRACTRRGAACGRTAGPGAARTRAAAACTSEPHAVVRNLRSTGDPRSVLGRDPGEQQQAEHADQRDAPRPGAASRPSDGVERAPSSGADSE